MPIATTFDAIRSAIVTAIRESTPTYAPSSDIRWRVVDQKKDVPSVGPRSFYVELSTPLEDGEITGGCAQHTADLLIWTSYGDMKDAEAQVLWARDHQDLWRVLHRAEIDGAPLYEKAGFELENDEGRLWGAHSFVATLFLPLP